jgi:hypothetical protein
VEEGLNRPEHSPMEKHARAVMLRRAALGQAA